MNELNKINNENQINNANPILASRNINMAYYPQGQPPINNNPQLINNSLNNPLLNEINILKDSSSAANKLLFCQMPNLTKLLSNLSNLTKLLSNLSNLTKLLSTLTILTKVLLNLTILTKVLSNLIYVQR